MSAPTEVARDLEAEMEAMEDVAARLRELLVAEREALGRRDREAIAAITLGKEQLIGRLDAHGRRQMELLTCAGQPATPAGLDAVLTVPGNEGLARRWARLRPVLSECREQNKVNGGMMRIAGQAVGRLLEVLRGGQRASVNLYGPGGTATGSGEGTFKARV